MPPLDKCLPAKTKVLLPRSVSPLKSGTCIINYHRIMFIKNIYIFCIEFGLWNNCLYWGPIFEKRALKFKKTLRTKIFAHQSFSPLFLHIMFSFDNHDYYFLSFMFLVSIIPFIGFRVSNVTIRVGTRRSKIAPLSIFSAEIPKNTLIFYRHTF